MGLTAPFQQMGRRSRVQAQGGLPSERTKCRGPRRLGGSIHGDLDPLRPRRPRRIAGACPDLWRRADERLAALAAQVGEPLREAWGRALAPALVGLLELALGDPVASAVALPLRLAEVEAALSRLPGGLSLAEAFAMHSAAAALEEWSRAASLLVSGPSAWWSSPVVGSALAALTSSLRAIVAWSKRVAPLPSSEPSWRLQCSRALELLFAQAVPDEDWQMGWLVQQERYAAPLLSPEAPLTEALLRSVADLLGSLPTTFAPTEAAGSDASASGSTGEAGRRLSTASGADGSAAAPMRRLGAGELSWLLGLLEGSFRTLAPQLAPGEVYALLLPGFGFLAGRAVDIGRPGVSAQGGVFPSGGQERPEVRRAKGLHEP